MDYGLYGSGIFWQGWSQKMGDPAVKETKKSRTGYKQANAQSEAEESR